MVVQWVLLILKDGLFTVVMLHVLVPAEQHDDPKLLPGSMPKEQTTKADVHLNFKDDNLKITKGIAAINNSTPSCSKALLDV